MILNKENILIKICDLLRQQCEQSKKALDESHQNAIDPENIPENKYDTTGLEASYLVQGQARHLEELEDTLKSYERFKFPEYNGTVQLGSLVLIEDDDYNEIYYFIGPKTGGINIEEGDVSVTLISFNSPIGQKLIGKYVGDPIEIFIDGQNKNFTLIDHR